MKAGIMVKKSYEILWKFFMKNALEFEAGIFEVPLPKKYEIKFFQLYDLSLKLISFDFLSERVFRAHTHTHTQSSRFF